MITHPEMAISAQQAPAVSLEGRGLVKVYGPRRVVDGIDLQVRGGEIVGLLGPNGAGKTTLISIVAGLLRASEGEVRVLGRSCRTSS